VLDLQVSDTIKVVLKEGGKRRGNEADKTLPPTKIQKFHPSNGIDNGSQMMETSAGIRIVSQKSTLNSMPDYLVMRLDSDGKWRLATELRV